MVLACQMRSETLLCAGEDSSQSARSRAVMAEKNREGEREREGERVGDRYPSSRMGWILPLTMV